MIAAILAAGKGTRMLPFSTRYPKPLLPICNKPLIQHQIEMVRDVGITEFLVVIGHLGYEIAQAMGDGSRLGVRIRYVEQTEMLGIANALGQLEPHVSSPILLLLGDIFFVAADLERMIRSLQQREAKAVLAVKKEESPEAIRRNFTVLVDEQGLVRRVIEKPRHPMTNIKGCGLYLFDLNVFDAIRRTPRTAMRDEYEITDTIQIMIDDGLPVVPESVIRWDLNLTTPGDVLRCNLFQLERLGLDSVVADGAKVHGRAELDRVVVGAGASIRHPIRVTNSLIFPGTDVTAEHDVDGFIITPEHQIDCRQLVATAAD
jgi:NDP-sugar pyrophosphorylase family protein